MRAIPSRPRGFHEDMALSHSKSLNEKEQKFHRIPSLSSKGKAAAARKEMELYLNPHNSKAHIILMHFIFWEMVGAGQIWSGK